MEFDAQKVWLYARKTNTEELLDRVTVFRGGMEPEALAIFEAELRDRGISREDIRNHADAQGNECLYAHDGTALECSFCRKPAVAEGKGWYRFLWGVVPIFPRKLRFCREHRPGALSTIE